MNFKKSVEVPNLHGFCGEPKKKKKLYVINKIKHMSIEALWAHC